MSAPVRAALVGYGMAGKVFHAPLICATEGLDLAVVVSSDAAKVQADLPDVAVVPDLATALSDASIDLIVIATPDHLHAEQALAALGAGKHVVIDKPFAPTLAEAKEVAARAAAAGRLVSIFQNRRWDADFLTLKRLMHDGSLGEIVQFESHFDRYRPDVSAVWKEQRGAGVWQDLGPHLVDQAVALFGMPQAVFADIAAQRAGAEAADYFHALLRYPDRRVILHASKMTHESGLRFAVHGANGSFIKHGLDMQEPQSIAGMKPGDADWGVDPVAGTLTQDGVATEVQNERGDARAYYAAMRDAIRGRGDVPVTPEQALGVMAVIDAGIISAKERREVSLTEHTDRSS